MAGQVIDRGAAHTTINRAPSYKKGGKVKSTGLAELHEGETVIPKGKKSGSSSCKSQGMKR